MNIMQGVTSTAAGGSTANVLTGQLYERAPYNGYAEFFITGDAAGEGRATIFIGGRVVQQESSVSRQARPPLIPDDFIVSAPMMKGEQLVINHRNTGAGANNLFWRVNLRPAR